MRKFSPDDKLMAAIFGLSPEDQAALDAQVAQEKAVQLAQDWKSADSIRQTFQKEFPQNNWMAALCYGNPCAVAITDNGAIKSEIIGRHLGYSKVSQIDLDLDKIEVRTK